MSHRTCDVDGCERKHIAKGMCPAHYTARYKKQPGYKRTSYERICDNCGETFRGARPTARFCDDACKGLWYSANGIKPPVAKSICRLPADHQVRVLIREQAVPRSPLRVAVESESWDDVVLAMQQKAVIVDGCWLWPRVDRSGYGRISIGGKAFGAHRLMAKAVRDGDLDRRMPVHHKCAEPTCVNPDHLQVVTPEQNVAEMLERRYYLERIAELELALETVAPGHPLVRRRISPAA